MHRVQMRDIIPLSIKTISPTNEGLMMEISPVSPEKLRQPVQSASSLISSSKRVRKQRVSSDRGSTVNKLTAEEGHSVVVSAPIEEQAVTVEVPGPRDPHTFISKRVIRRRSAHLSLQDPSQLMLTTEGGGFSPAADGSLSLLRSPSSLDQQMNNSLTSVADECVMAILSCCDESLLYSCGRRGVETSSQVSPQINETFETIPMMSTSTPPPSLPVSCEYLVTPLLLLSRKQKKSQPSNTHALSFALMEGTQCNANVSKKSTGDRRTFTIGPPRLVTRGERERLEVAQSTESFVENKILESGRDSKDIVEDCCVDCPASTPIILECASDAGTSSLPPSASLAGICPETPLSVTEELLNDEDDASNSHFSQGMRRPFIPKEKRNVTAGVNARCVIPPLSSKTQSQSFSRNTHSGRTRERHHGPVVTTGRISSVRIVSRSVDKGTCGI